MACDDSGTNTDALREAVCEAMLRLELTGLNTGTAGNLSVRVDDGFLVTPSGVPPRALSPGRVVRLDHDGRAAAPGARPSSEWRIHRDLYAARPDTAAIVHTHSPYATALACAHRPIPAFHYMVAVAGGDSVRCAPYATFGTQALSDAALAALDGRRACLLANHGQLALGTTLEAAVALAVEVESLARQYALTLAIGEPVLLDETEMKRVIEKFADYGATDG